MFRRALLVLLALPILAFAKSPDSKIDHCTSVSKEYRRLMAERGRNSAMLALESMRHGDFIHASSSSRHYLNDAEQAYRVACVEVPKGLSRIKGERASYVMATGMMYAARMVARDKYDDALLALQVVRSVSYDVDRPRPEGFETLMRTVHDGWARKWFERLDQQYASGDLREDQYRSREKEACAALMKNPQYSIAPLMERCLK